MKFNDEIYLFVIITQSPSARKVWIEIIESLVKENADNSHLPRGRCGLKWELHPTKLTVDLVTFREEGVD